MKKIKISSTYEPIDEQNYDYHFKMDVQENVLICNSDLNSILNALRSIERKKCKVIWLKKKEFTHLTSGMQKWFELKNSELQIIDHFKINQMIREHIEKHELPILNSFFDDEIIILFYLLNEYPRVKLEFNTKNQTTENKILIENLEKLKLLDVVYKKEKKINIAKSKKSQILTLGSQFDQSQYNRNLAWLSEQQKFDLVLTKWQNNFIQDSEDLFKIVRSHDLQVFKTDFNQKNQIIKNQKMFDISKELFLINSSFHSVLQANTEYSTFIYVNQLDEEIISRLEQFETRSNSEFFYAYSQNGKIIFKASIPIWQKLIKLAYRYQKLLNLSPIDNIFDLLKLNCSQLQIKFQQVI